MEAIGLPSREDQVQEDEKVDAFGMDWMNSHDWLEGFGGDTSQGESGRRGVVFLMIGLDQSLFQAIHPPQQPVLSNPVGTDMFFSAGTPYNGDWYNAFDSPTFINAITSRLPVVEGGTFQGGGENGAIPVFDLLGEGDLEKDPKIVKVTWFRPHGPTAIAPGTCTTPLISDMFSGLKRLTLKVRVESPPATLNIATPGITHAEGPQTQVYEGMPPKHLMRHLIETFIQHFGCQFPSLEKETLEADLQGNTGSVFLFNCIAATASR